MARANFGDVLMPLTKFPIGPGVFKDDTPLKSEGFAIEAQWMRWRRDSWQVMGGYQAASNDTFDGFVRGGHAWADLSGSRAAGFGTAANLYAFYGGDIRDITPFAARGTLVNPFQTENGSTQVLVGHLQHGLKPGSTVTYALADPVGGITINGTYTVTIRDLNSYWITHTSSATSDATGGGKVEYSAPLDIGRIDGIGGIGYGTGPYGTGPYGTPSSGDINPRVWSCANWGHTGLFVPDNGALYMWQPQAEYPELLPRSVFTAWKAGTGWTVNAGSGLATAVAGVASDLYIDLTGVLSGGVSYDSYLPVTRTAGGFQFRIVSDPTGTPVDITFGETIDKTANYSRRFTAPANPTRLKISKDATFAGTVDLATMSVKVIADAFRIMDAPPYARDMFVDDKRIVVLLGTVEQDGDFNAMLVRWSDQENLFTWTANSDNQAGEFVLGIGSEIRGGLASRGQNYIWTDAALYTMRYTSSSDVFRIDHVGSGAGLRAKNACAEFNGVAFWWGADDNFYLIQGGAPQLLECPMRKDVTENLSPNQQAKISCGVNSQFGEVVWLYPDRRDGDGKEPSRYLIYNWDANCWYTGFLDRSQWIDSGVFQNPMAFGLDGKIYYHDRSKSANGDPLPWSLKTGLFDLGDGDTHFNVMRFVPDFADQEGAIKLEFWFRQFAQSEDVQYGSYQMTPGTEKVDMRHSGRLMSMAFSGEGAPAFNRFGSFRMDIRPSGARR